MNETIGAWRVERHAVLGSTNDEARARALAGDAGRLWIVAREQTRGRGRLGRAWTSLRGNLFASALLVDPSPVVIAPQLGFVAGLALRRALDDLGADGEVKLKWPNDVVWRGAKLAGVLVEGLAIGPRFACVVGIGVNCASAPTGLAYPADTVASALGRPVAADDLFARLALRFEECLALWERGAGFVGIRAGWLERAGGLGSFVRVVGPHDVRQGVFETLDERGGLVLRGVDGDETVEVGDVFLLNERVSPDAPGIQTVQKVSIE